MTTGSAPLSSFRRLQRADGLACVLAIGTANPPNCVPQADFPDFYFRATNSDHLTNLKHKFKRLCKHSHHFLLLSHLVANARFTVCVLSVAAGDKTDVKRRYLYYTEDMLAARPELADNAAPSLDARLDIAAKAVPELAAKAAEKAIAEWGSPAADVTHLVVTTNSGAHVPGVDLRLVQLLGLRPSMRRTMLYLNGCSAGCAALRLAKDLAENTRGARVLVVAAELTLMLFTGPEEGDSGFMTLFNQALFGDGAAAVIIGADTMDHVEHPLFEIVSAAQTIIPESDQTITMSLTSRRLDGNICTKHAPGLIGSNVEHCLLDSFGPLGFGGRNRWNDMFWVVHPGATTILDQIDAVLGLEPGKLAASRRVLSEYGNMFDITVFFVLDEMRRRMEDGAEGESPEWGAMMAFGPGLTVETMVLHATPTERKCNLHENGNAM
uniref:Chalcone/stilbene synthase N-terminal domain-containing protein n=1 Tax=Leersia perrieri TaxID=77586 RepID=A0A0D9WZN4_9ORYZ